MNRPLSLLVGLAAVLVGCTADDASPPPDAGRACAEDARRCVGDVVQICDDGDWSPVGLCDHGCADGACVDETCTPMCVGRQCGDDGCGGDCGGCGDGAACLDGACVTIANCGDDVCGDDEDCSTCPADCGACCGDGACTTEHGEDCATCPADCGCPEGARCDAELADCVPACTPIACGDVECGGDGCGGLCGRCDDGLDCLDGGCVEPPPTCGDTTCDPSESCRTCPADCGACCGDGACTAEHDEDCATCPADCACPEGERCAADARACQPACPPDCDDRQCGDDGCGGDCGACAPDDSCDADGLCVEPPPTCGDSECTADEDCATCPADCGACCGDGACRGGETCATCPADCLCGDDERCDVEARTCVLAECEPQCQGRICGDDGCGGACGRCEGGELCDPEIGRCEAPCVPACDDRVCGDDGCGDVCGTCPAGWACDDGRCEAPCVPDCDDRACGDDGCGDVCGTCDDDARCADGLCVDAGFRCECPVGWLCIAGNCHVPAEACGARADGLCDDGGECYANACRPPLSPCDDDAEGGVCPLGALCDDGDCEAIEVGELCDDDNACTVDTYDVVADACVRAPRDGACDDGDACTVGDACAAGVCRGMAVAGCSPELTLDAYPTYTAQPRVELSGQRGAGVAVLVDGEVAVPTGDTPWLITLDLAPGENVFAVRARDAAREGADRRVRIVYETDPPTVDVNPAGQTFLDGVTVTVAASEPATVHYTTDGSVPDATSPAFDTLHTFRLFDDTTLSLRARDRAGNWQPDVHVEDYRFTGADNAWTDGARLAIARVGAAAASDGTTIWVIGGDDGAAPRASVERLDGDRWVDGPGLPSARAHAAAAALGGRLYVFGGLDAAGRPLDRVERLIDGVWRVGAALSTARAEAAAVVVDGRIHLLGGRDALGAVSAHAVYDPNTDAWSPARPLPRPRRAFAAVRAPDGRIHLIGGEDDAGRALTPIDVYDPTTDTWSVGPALPTARVAPAAGLDDNAGAVLGGGASLIVAGGLVDGAPTATVDEYLFTEQRWVRRRPLPAPRSHAAAASTIRPGPLDARRALWLIGGRLDAAPTPTTTRYHRDRDGVRGRAALPAARVDAAAVALDERIYLFGGAIGGAATVGALLYDPETGHSAPVAPLPAPRADASAVVYADRAWLIGGHDAAGVTQPNVYSYDRRADAWTNQPRLPIPVTDAVAAATRDRIYVIGGADTLADGALDAVQVFDPMLRRWSPGPPLPAPRRGAVAVTWQGRIYVAGGRDAGGAVHPDLVMFDPALRTWSVVAPTGFARVDATAARLAARLVVLGGRGPDGAPTAERFVYPLDGETAPSLPLRLDNRLFAPHARAATVTHNGALYTLSGETPAGASDAVLTYAGRCLDGRIGPGEGAPPYDEIPDLGAGCGDTDVTVALAPLRAFGHHGDCTLFNACGNAEGCADLACSWFGHGEAESWRSGFCTIGTPLDCDLFRDGGATLDTGFSPIAGCQPRVVYEVVCRVQ